MGLYDAPTDLNDRTRTIVKLAQHEDEAVFVKQQCMHCVDPACASACMLGALQKREFGVVSWDPALCIGCRYCQIACPFNVPKFEWDSATPRIVKCDLCSGRVASGGRPACASACPRDAVVFGNRAELLTEARRRIADDPERYVGHVYGELDFGGTQVLYLSGIPFEELGFAMERGRPTHEVQRSLQHGLYQGFAAPAALYAVFAGVLWRQRRARPDSVHATDGIASLPEVPEPEPMPVECEGLDGEPPILVGAGSYGSPGEEV
jgi:Fe-S-cluster-containing dehydrogenase component